MPDSDNTDADNVAVPAEVIADRPALLGAERGGPAATVSEEADDDVDPTDAFCRSWRRYLSRESAGRF